MQEQSDDFTIEGAAKINFEPWSAENLERCKPPSNDEAITYLVSLRAAWLILGKTKNDLQKMCSENEEIVLALLDDLEATKRFFTAAVEIVETANARIISAACAVGSEAQRGDE